jgi:hypothetical protein
MGKPRIDMEAPMRTKDRKDKEEPQLTQHITDKVEHSRVSPSTDSDDAKRDLLLMDKVAPS